MRGIDEWLPHQKAQGPVRIERQINWGAAPAGVFDAARTKTVDGERYIAPGCDPLSPAFVEPPPIPIAPMQQHDGGRGACAVCLPQVTLQRKWAGKRVLEFNDGRGRFGRSRGAFDRVSDQERSDECSDFGEVRQEPPFRATVRPPIIGPRFRYPAVSARWPLIFSA